MFLINIFKLFAKSIMEGIRQDLKFFVAQILRVDLVKQNQENPQQRL